MAGGIGGGKLTDKAIKAFATKAERGKKLADGGGLHLFVTPAGGITWRIKYRLDGKEKLYSVGPYPLVPLAAARVELGEVKALILEGKDPVTHRRVNRAAHAASADNTFQAVAEEWLAMKKKEWSAGHHTKSSRALERDIYPSLGKLPIASITPAIADLLPVNRLICATSSFQLGDLIRQPGYLLHGRSTGVTVYCHIASPINEV